MLEALDALQQHRDVVTGRLVRQLHQCDFQQQPRVWGVAHFHQHLAQPLHGTHSRGSAHALSQRGDFFGTLYGQLHQLGRHQREEAVAQVADDVVGERARVAALLHGHRNNSQRAPGVVLDERFDELVEWGDVERLAPAGRNQFQR